MATHHHRHNMPVIVVETHARYYMVVGLINCYDTAFRVVYHRHCRTPTGGVDGVGHGGLNEGDGGKGGSGGSGGGGGVCVCVGGGGVSLCAVLCCALLMAEL